eukprot:gene27990-36879_t
MRIRKNTCGALSATGTDMAKFMIAHLSASNPLLDAKTAQLMYTTANTPIPGMPGMALGFYHEGRNGLNIIGHGGDTDWFHSDLHLYRDKGVGLYLSFNSGGKEGAAHVLRERMFDSFTDRYFPHAGAALPTLATAAEHGRALAGHYVSSRGSVTNWLRIVNLIGQASVTVNDDNTITVSALTNAAGVPKRWRETAPWQWQEVGGEDRLGAMVKDGKPGVKAQVRNDGRRGNAPMAGEKVDILAMLFGKKKRRIIRLLLVEDEPLVAFDNERFLVDEEFVIVATVDRVADAVQVIRGDDPIDLVLVDISLADGSGLDVARAAYECGIAAMFVTGDCPAGGEEVALGCLAKPYAQRDLLAAISAVEAVLDGRPPKRLPGGFRIDAVQPYQSPGLAAAGQAVCLA